MDTEQLKKTIQDRINSDTSQILKGVSVIDDSFKSAANFIGAKINLIKDELGKTAEALPYFPEAFGELRDKIRFETPVLKELNKTLLRGTINTYSTAYQKALQDLKDGSIQRQQLKMLKSGESGSDEQIARELANRAVINEQTQTMAIGATEPLALTGSKILQTAARLAKLEDLTSIKGVLKRLGLGAEKIETIAPKIAQETDKTIIVRLLRQELLKIPTPVSALSKITTQATKIASKAVKPAVNLERLAITPEAKQTITDITAQIQKELEAIKGKPLSHSEVLEAAKISDMLKGLSTREATLNREATLLKTRQALSTMAEGKGVSPDFIQTLERVRAEGTTLARQLESLKIKAQPGMETLEATKIAIVKKLRDVGIKTDDILKRAEGVDFTDLRQVTKFYRQFVKPSLGEIIDEYRYINLLSSPRTHIVNAFSNLTQATVLSPATKLATGSIDYVASALTGKARQAYVSEVPAYYKGLFNAVPDALKSFWQALGGKAIVTRPDIAQIPTGSKILAPFQWVTRLLEASDVFFRSLIAGGEREALFLKAKKSGKKLDEKALAKIEELVKDKASYYVFRKMLDPDNKTGQGELLSYIDKLTSGIYSLRNRVGAVKWFLPFIMTPMNILKQGIEYSPLGLATLKGASNKTEQLAKTMIGSSVFLGAGWLALNGQTTWALPTGQKEREAFFASGRQPYAVKIGNEWVSYSKLGPLAYPIAMASAVQWYAKENPKAVSDSAFEKTVKVLGGVAEFFSDQSYVQGIADLINVFQDPEQGVREALVNLPSQLIPLSSFLRWTAQIIDPVYRKPQSGFSVDAIIENMKKQLPFLSKDLESYKTPLGLPSKRQLPALNAVSPVAVSKENALGELQLQTIRQQAKMKNLKTKIKTDLEKKIKAKIKK